MVIYNKDILVEEQLWYYLINSWKSKKAHIFPNGIRKWM